MVGFLQIFAPFKLYNIFILKEFFTAAFFAGSGEIRWLAVINKKEFKF